MDSVTGMSPAQSAVAVDGEAVQLLVKDLQLRFIQEMVRVPTMVQLKEWHDLHPGTVCHGSNFAIIFTNLTVQRFVTIAKSTSGRTVCQILKNRITARAHSVPVGLKLRLLAHGD